MVKWYNESLPRISGGFDSLWPHKEKDPPGVFFDCGQRVNKLGACLRGIEARLS